ncbi:CmpA/NrtA family ABC transporter substrate-binding protein [Bauldia litoralis]|uniref:NitT/TauT family transport system ATP-binding protein n=1 Tax=Bauldia litoralis TaxID=665467 RepID=A0A1G6A641_9HYPH|nr:CmpA/NrtA family ABC transporter substrate-binding protein [Bauldia litoralis]SDB03878.1 NitT/TauT family transport system ATP-binding protein [Bauldia litoralis]
MAATTDIFAGFIPLTDSAILVAARECGFAEEERIALSLIRETSWANIRDRIAIGHFQAAHMLAPMPIAAALGLTPLSQAVLAPMALGLGGNAVTVSLALFDEMQAVNPVDMLDPASSGAALRELVRQRRDTGRPRLRFGVVHPHSGHNFELRYWLASSGIRPDEDVEIVIAPPPFMPDVLAAGRVDGYCVGEPWNSVAVASGAGRIATVKSAIWNSSPEKVLGVHADWAGRNPEALARLIRALYRAAQWCSTRENHAALAHILARPDYLDQPASLVIKAIDGSILGGRGARSGIAFFEPFAGAATFPWQSHALWFYSQMVRWGQVAHTPANAEAARLCFRPDIYRAALTPLGGALPGANAKVEGALKQPSPVGATAGSLVLAADGFFDGAVFDPDRLDDYIATQMPLRTPSA